MKLSREEVQRVAVLARLRLTPEEQSSLTDELDRILGYMDKLNQLDTADVDRSRRDIFQSSQDHRMSFAQLTLHEAGAKLRKRELSSVELTEAVFQRIADTDDKVHAYLTLARDAAMEQARGADKELKGSADHAALLGVPIALKDNFLTKGLRTTCASKILGDFMPPYDATTVDRLRSTGAVIVGKTNLDEFAMGSSAENSAFFPTSNPWNLARIPGGSSGGSAAAVAADLCIAALGTDTGGSIRQPAACCGIVGLKPTYGRVSRYGIIAFASSMDQVGPMTKNVRDSALLLEAVAGRDPADSTSADLAVPRYSAMLTGDIKGLRLGIPKEYFVSGMQREVEQAVRAAIGKLEKNGAIIDAGVRPVAPPGLVTVEPGNGPF